MNLAMAIEAGATAEELRRHVAGLRPDQRRRECLGLSGPQQRALWRLVGADGPGPEGELVTGRFSVFEGRNSLRLFTSFEKWFTRQGDRVVGCNRHALSALIGPGYFSVERRWAGGLEFDYTQVPAVAPSGWPSVRPNSRPLARPVYGDLLDRVVWLAPDVLVGSAFRRGTPLDSYFILVRAR